MSNEHYRQNKSPGGQWVMVMIDIKFIDAPGDLTINLHHHNTKHSISIHIQQNNNQYTTHTTIKNIHTTLIITTQTLTNHKMTLGRVLERVTDTVTALVDTLMPEYDKNAE
jgi:hypothetical protein